MTFLCSARASFVTGTVDPRRRRRGPRLLIRGRRLPTSVDRHSRGRDGRRVVPYARRRDVLARRAVGAFGVAAGDGVDDRRRARPTTASSASADARRVDPLDEVGQLASVLGEQRRCRRPRRARRGTAVFSAGKSARRPSPAARRPASTTPSQARRAAAAVRRCGGEPGDEPSSGSRSSNSSRARGASIDRHARARRGSMLDEPSTRERLQRLADRVARHVEAAGDLLLDEPLALGVVAGDDAPRGARRAPRGGAAGGATADASAGRSSSAAAH